MTLLQSRDHQIMAFHPASRMATPPGYHTPGNSSRQPSPADLSQATYREHCGQLPLALSRSEPIPGMSTESYVMDMGSCSPASQSQTFSRASSQMTPATSHEDLDFCYQDSPRLAQYPPVPTQSSYPDPGPSTSMHIDLRLDNLPGEEQLREPKNEPWSPPPLRNPSPIAPALSTPPSEDDTAKKVPAKDRPKHFILPDDAWYHDINRPELTEQYINYFCTKHSVGQRYDGKGQRLFVWPDKVPYIAILALCFLTTSEQRLKEAQDKYSALGMPVADIYKWVEAYTDKVSSTHDGKGHQNSLRHNLSMNDAFRRISKDTGEEVLKRNGKKADERGTIWVILGWDVQGNMQSTAAYRKNKKPQSRKRPANRARAESGRRGGQAASRTRIFRQERRDAARQEALQQQQQQQQQQRRMLNMDYMVHLQPPPYPMHHILPPPPVTHGFPVSQSQHQPFFPSQHQHQHQEQDYYGRGGAIEYNQHQNGQSNVGAYTYNSQNNLNSHPTYGPPPTAVTSYPTYSPPAMARDASQNQVDLALQSDFNPMVTSAPMMMGNNRIVGSSGPAYQPQWDGQHFTSVSSETSDLQ